MSAVNLIKKQQEQFGLAAIKHFVDAGDPPTDIELSMLGRMLDMHHIVSVEAGINMIVSFRKAYAEKEEADRVRGAERFGEDNAPPQPLEGTPELAGADKVGDDTPAEA